MSPITTALFGQTAPEGAAAPGGMFGLGSPFMMIALMVVVFYFVLWRPQAKEKKRVAEFRQGLKRGDRVWTQGGVIGTVAQVEDQAVVVDVGGGNKLRVLKTFVGGEWKEKGEAAPEPEAKK
jgi:preprotein translocase subunit YajC